MPPKDPGSIVHLGNYSLEILLIAPLSIESIGINPHDIIMHVPRIKTTCSCWDNQRSLHFLSTTPLLMSPRDTWHLSVLTNVLARTCSIVL